LALEAKRDFLHPLFPETATFLSSFSAVNDAINLIKSTLETSLGQLQSLFTIVAQEFYSTKCSAPKLPTRLLPSRSMVSIAQKASHSSRTAFFTLFANYRRRH
jgi:hypothetical protein